MRYKKKKILNKIIKINERRKKIEKYHFDKIDLNKLSKEKGIIYFYDSDIPEGIIGILASKIKLLTSNFLSEFKPCR